ncbi:hypothetical protein LWI28_028820 [Acer negundo]|uniref:Myb/SANT-like domain-containing protein n=1 Tax=Acer negundo TaxID=4023 RepID=A0AAD5NGD6_ACENE|nr:hypothetical protein LWI28_028820 [Acer negundo]
MVEAVGRGWRDASGLLSKQTVETRILPSLNEKLNCNKTYNNYQSRLKWFKVQYQIYTELMRHSSGFGWDPITRRFTTSEEVWEDYLKSHPKEGHFHTKHYVDYEDLRIVIRNVTALGKNTIGLGDDTDVRTFGVEDIHVEIEDYDYDVDNGAFVQSQHEPLHQFEIVMVMSIVMDERDGEGGFVKRVKIKVVEDGDTCDNVLEKGFVGGHSIFDIPFFG